MARVRALFGTGTSLKIANVYRPWHDGTGSATLKSRWVPLAQPGDGRRLSVWLLPVVLRR